ncbi:GTP pyrophosphokinase [bacterium M21]|nr:GTP pyrophosphokinase [bacterium M21]
MSTIQNALDIANNAHRDQKLKNGQPYILHPLHVMNQVSSIEAKIVAILHDVVEDTETELVDLEAAGFAPEIMRAVDLLTRRDGDDYKEYVKALAKDPLAREVKLADLRHNMDVTRLPEVTDLDLQRLRKYHWCVNYLG